MSPNSNQSKLHSWKKKAHLAQVHLGSWSFDIFSNIVKWSDESYRNFSHNYSAGA